VDYVLLFLARLLRRLGMACTVYKKRHPEKSDLYKIAYRYFEAYERCYEKRYESEYGHFRAIIRATVWKYLDCGIMEHGFARARCPGCGYDFFVAFSCKTRFFCPSCAQKRTLIWGEWVSGVLADVDHRQWVFTIPKVLRKLFYKDRLLLASLARFRGGHHPGTVPGYFSRQALPSGHHHINPDLR